MRRSPFISLKSEWRDHQWRQWHRHNYERRRAAQLLDRQRNAFRRQQWHDQLRLHCHKTGATEVTATVDYATVDGTATAPSDYTAIPVSTLTFAPGDTTMPVTVLVNGDTVYEPDETFTVHLSNPTGATISNADGTGTITNDDDCTEQPANMVAWYAGEDNTKDIQGPTFEDASWAGTPLYATGEVGRAFSFNGSNFVTVPAGSGPLNISGNEVTIDGWIKPAAITGAVYFGKTQSSGNSYLLYNPGTVLEAIIKTGSGGEKVIAAYADYPADNVFLPAGGRAMDAYRPHLRRVVDENLRERSPGGTGHPDRQYLAR